MMIFLTWENLAIETLGFVADRHKAGARGQMLALKVVASHPVTLVPVCEG